MGKKEKVRKRKNKREIYKKRYREGARIWQKIYKEIKLEGEGESYNRNYKVYGVANRAYT